ncbi:MAG: MAPEG family protein [Steroidobacteraceae bacterium]
MTMNPLLGPVVALAGWSIVMLVWLALARSPYVQGRLPDGTRGAEIEKNHPGKANWPAHNYTHLMEQPTIFYAIVFVLVLTNSATRANVYLAWAYFGFRVLHSLVQATVNVVRVRFALFLLATICLTGLTVDAGLRLIAGG